jgi:GntR family transcriptional regulator, vanillate catabolism transcriptional regulator
MSDDANSQTLKAVLGLRGMIVDGVLAAGARVAEPLLVEKFGVSRTPARMALVQVRDEGLLETIPSGGFVVASFSEQDIREAIEIRGTFEGMAARYAAERGVSPTLLAPLEKCVAALDGVIAQSTASFDLNDYVRLNDRFHELLVDCAQSVMIKRSLQRIISLPFAAPNAFIMSSRSNSTGVRDILFVSQEQHRSIVDAIKNRQGTRAESIAIEHSRSAWKYLELAMHDEEQMIQWPGLRLLASPG